MSWPGACAHDGCGQLFRQPKTGRAVIVSWRLWRRLRAKRQPFPYGYQQLVLRLTGQPGTFYTLGEALRPPPLIRRGVRMTSMVIALVLGILSPLLVIMALIAFGLSFLIAPVLMPVFIALFCAQMPAAMLGATARVNDIAVINSTPPGQSGLLWMCAAHMLARRSLAIDLIFIYIGFIAFALVTGIVLLPAIDGLPMNSPVAAGLVVGTAVAVFLSCDIIQTTALSILLGWTIVWGDEENTSQARLISSSLVMILQVGLYVSSLLLFALLQMTVQAGAALLVINILARELLVTTFARGLLRQGMELDAILGLHSGS